MGKGVSKIRKKCRRRLWMVPYVPLFPSSIVMDRIWARVCADLHIVIPCSLAQSRILNLNLASIDQKENRRKKKLLGSCIHIFVK